MDPYPVPEGNFHGPLIVSGTVGGLVKIRVAIALKASGRGPGRSGSRTVDETGKGMLEVTFEDPTQAGGKDRQTDSRHCRRQYK